jgi:hypothetical protein
VVGLVGLWVQRKCRTIQQKVSLVVNTARQVTHAKNLPASVPSNKIGWHVSAIHKNESFMIACHTKHICRYVNTAYYILIYNQDFT